MNRRARRPPNRPDELVFLPLGGVGEIGMNLSSTAMPGSG